MEEERDSDPVLFIVAFTLAVLGVIAVFAYVAALWCPLIWECLVWLFAWAAAHQQPGASQLAAVAQQHVASR